MELFGAESRVLALVESWQVHHLLVVVRVNIILISELINGHCWIGDSFVALLNSSHEFPLPSLILRSQGEIIPSVLVTVGQLYSESCVSRDIVILAISVVNKLIVVALWHIFED